MSSAQAADPVDGFGQIIYTSGSTGQPKGVRHESGQIAWSAAALAAATGATAEDTYLSVLPLPLLLETICSIFIPAMLGAYVHSIAGWPNRWGVEMRRESQKHLIYTDPRQAWWCHNCSNNGWENFR